MSRTLDPDQFLCPVDGFDLTREVELEVFAESTSQVSGLGGEDSVNEESDQGRRQAGFDSKSHFKVEVGCPGEAAAGRDAKPHRQRFAGVVR